MVIRYHKGIKNTLVYLGSDKWEINDIVVRQDGQVFCDWDFTNNTLLPTRLLYDGMRDMMRRRKEQMDEVPSTCGGFGGCGGGVNYTPRFSCGGGCSSCG
jgi:hypothetical protein